MTIPMCSRFFVVLSCAALLVVSACKKEENDPIPQPDTVAIAQPKQAQEKSAPQQEAQPETPIAVEKQDSQTEQPPQRFKNPTLRFRKPLPPKEKGDTYPEMFMGMEGKIGKEFAPSATARTWTLKAIRTVEHEYFDRIIFEFDGEEPPGYSLEYLEMPSRLCNSGIRVRTEGRAQIQLTLHSVSIASDSLLAKDRYKLSFPIMRELVRTCEQDGNLVFVVGTTSQKKFRLCELQNPPRIMLDLRNNHRMELEEGDPK